MSEPSSKWGQEIKRDIAILLEKHEAIGRDTKALADDLKGVRERSDSATHTLRIWTPIAMLLLIGILGDSIWNIHTSRVEIGKIAKNETMIGELVEQRKATNESLEELSTTIAQIQGATTKSNADIKQIVDGTAATVEKVQTALNEGTPALLKSVDEIKIITESAKKSAIAAEQAAEQTRQLAVAAKGVAEQTLKAASTPQSHRTRVYTGQIAVSLVNLAKDNTDAPDTVFDVDLGLEFSTSEVLQITASVQNDRLELREAGITSLVITGEARDEGVLRIRALALPNKEPLTALLQKKEELLVEFSIVTSFTSSN